MASLFGPSRRKTAPEPAPPTPETAQVGSELDALIAEQFYGLPVVWRTPPYAGSATRGLDPNARYPWLKGFKDGCNYDWAPVGPYSTQWNAAMPLFVDAIERFGEGSLSSTMEEWDVGGLFACEFLGGPAVLWLPGPEAICRAVLAALADQPDEAGTQ